MSTYEEKLWGYVCNLLAIILSHGIVCVNLRRDVLAWCHMLMWQFNRALYCTGLFMIIEYIILSHYYDKMDVHGRDFYVINMKRSNVGLLPDT